MTSNLLFPMILACVAMAGFGYAVGTLLAKLKAKSSQRSDRERDTTMLIWLSFITLWGGFLYLWFSPAGTHDEMEPILHVVLQMCNGIVCYYFGKQSGQNGNGHAEVKETEVDAKEAPAKPPVPPAAENAKDELNSILERLNERSARND